MQKVLLIGLSIVLAGLTIPLSVVAKESITWMEADFPPFLIHEGAFAGLGYGDVGTDIIIENLPQYKHQKVTANLSRQYQQYQQHEKVCTVGLYKNPEREQFMHFSIPVFYSLPIRLIINKSKFVKFGSKATVKFEDILKSNNYIIGHSPNRSYGAEIDELLKKFANDRNIFINESRGELAESFFKMLEQERLDAILGAPEEVLYQAEKLGMREQLMTITIEENQQNLESWLSYVTCAKTEWGKKVIDDINKILIEQRPTARYRGGYERWIDPNSLDAFRRTYDEVFLNTTE